MKFLPSRELRLRPGRVWKDLKKAREMVVTANGRPVALLTAQVLYVARPFFGEGAQTFAHTLESDDEARAFADFLDGGLG